VASFFAVALSSRGYRVVYLIDFLHSGQARLTSRRRLAINAAVFTDSALVIVNGAQLFAEEIRAVWIIGRVVHRWMWVTRYGRRLLAWEGDRDGSQSGASGRYSLLLIGRSASARVVGAAGSAGAGGAGGGGGVHQIAFRARIRVSRVG
jgi:hypothetical protein